MFFEKDELSFRLVDVVHFTQENGKATVTGRNFDALSFRFASQGVLRANGRTVAVSNGSVCLTPARLPYVRESVQEDLIAVHFHMENYDTDQIEHVQAKDPERMGALFTKLLTCWNRKEKGYKYQCAALFYEILALCHLENEQKAPQPGVIAPSLDYLKEHFTDPELTVEVLAAKSFVSTVYFRRQFKRLFGVSPAKYLILRRIQYACSLMASGYYSLKEVAFLSGYRDYPYFSAEFKRIKGVTPSAYVYHY